MHGFLQRSPLGCVMVLAAGSVGCAMMSGAGRQGTVEATAEIEAKVDAALMSLRSEIKNEVSTQVRNTLQANIGDEIGRDQTHTTTDSWTSVILAMGTAVTPFVGLALYYRSRMQQGFQAAKRVIGTIEKARKREPCDCGACADCIVRTLRVRGDGVGKTLHKMVKSVT
jgi:hypothetical protein